MAKNITLAVDEDVIVKVRRIAADRDTTVNALVRDFLTNLASQDDRSARARRELLKLSETSTAELGEDWKWDRGSIYDRAVFSRHERPPVRSGRPKSGSNKT
jgi:hypothetical protein